MSALGRIIRSGREAKGIGLVDAADSMGVRKQVFSNYESGATGIKLDKLELFSKKFNIPLCDLVRAHFLDQLERNGLNLKVDVK